MSFEKPTSPERPTTYEGDDAMRREFVGITVMGARPTMQILRRGLMFLVGIVLMVAVLTPERVQAQLLPEGASEVVANFDGPFQNPEGVAVDKSGNVFVSFFDPLGQVWKFTPNGDTPVVCSLTVALGLAVDAPGNAFVAGGTLTAEGLLTAVFRIPREGGPCEQIPGTEQIVNPNALAFDKVGNLYVTDSLLGRIYRTSPGGQVELWSDDPLLSFADPPNFAEVGANGIQYWKGSLIVANTDLVSILRIPVLDDGSAGAVEVLHNAFVDPGPLFIPDGIALDTNGDIYVADPGLSQLVRVARDGSFAELVAAAPSGAPLDSPTSLTFGTGMQDRKNVFMANSAVFDPTDPPQGPSLVKIGTGTPGNPLP
jgi:sugar lactone lactonase YvrE